MRAGFSTLLGLAGLAGAVFSHPTKAAEYVLSALPMPPGVNKSYGYGLSNQGHAVGTYLAPSLLIRAFIYSGGVTKDLGMLGVSGANAFSVNDFGQVAGYSPSTNDSGFSRGFLYDNGTLINLGSLNNSISYAYGVNNRRQVVGTSFSSEGDRAIVWANGGMASVGVLGRGHSSSGVAINSMGQVAGQSQTARSERHAILRSGQGLYDLGTLPGGNDSGATAINNLGQVVGWSDTPLGVRAFLWSAGTGMLNLGSVTGGRTEATGINDHGQVVGWEERTNGLRSAFLWTPQTGMQDLNALLPPNTGWRAEIARGINDYGQIIGEGSYLNGNTRAVLLSPVFTNLVVQPKFLSDDAGFRVTVMGPADEPCEILATENPAVPFTQWPVIATGSLTNGFWHFADPQSPAPLRRFYLARSSG